MNAVWRAASLGMAVGLLATPAPAAEVPVNVAIDSGVLVGTVRDGVRSFKGVPYVAASVGALR